MKRFITINLFLVCINPIFSQVEDGYTNKLSYNVGETVVFFTKTQQNSGISQFAIQDVNNTIISNPIIFINTIQPNANTNEPSTNGFNYTQTATWTIPSNLKSGIYFLIATTPIPIIVKGNKATADIVVLCSTTNKNLILNT